jgi:hypothetical protein
MIMVPAYIASGEDPLKTAGGIVPLRIPTPHHSH